MKNTPIRIIDSDFNLLGEIDDYESLIFIRRFYKVGEFELHININKNNVDMLQEDNLIILGNNVKKVGVIRHREIQLGEQGENTETLIVKGYTLKGVLGRRIIVPPTGQGYDNAAGSQEQIMKQFVFNNVVNPSDINRKIPQLVIAPNQNRGKQDKWRGRFEKLSDKLQEIGEYAGLGWDVWLDIENCKWVFDVIQGRNLTANQDTLPPVIFSVDFDNIKGQTYIDSSLNYSNVGYAGGKGEEEKRLIQQVGEASGLDRIESFLDCSNTENITELKEQGNKELTELKKIQTFESQVIDFGSFIYGQDWDLGDIVTVQNRKWNVTMDARIVEVKEVYEVGGFNLELTFGNNVPTILDKIKNLEKQKLVEAKTGVNGANGTDGKSIEFAWNGTQLGIKQEGQQEYKYVNLQGNTGERGPQGLHGQKGDTGPQGLPGKDGKSLEFIWNGTSLGIRKEGDTSYSYVNLKGEKGNTGPVGPQGAKGETGIQGPKGAQGIQGPKGDIGERGPIGPQGVQGVKGDKGNTGPVGPKGADGLTTSIKLGSTQYNQNGGIISLPAYPTMLPASGGNADTVDGKHYDDIKEYVNKGINDIKIGGRNLLIYSMIQNSGVTDFDISSYITNGTLGFKKNSAWTGVALNFNNAKPNTEYILSYDLQKTSGELLNIGGHCVENWQTNTLYINGVEHGNYSNPASLTDTILIYHIKVYFKTPETMDSDNLIYIQPNRGENTEISVLIKKLKLEEGNKVTDWTPAPEDVLNLMPTKLSQLTNDIGAGGGTNIVCSKTEPNIKQGEWWFKE